MQRNSGDRSAMHAHYSPTAKDSVGLYIERNWEEDFTYVGLQYNRLAKRWNGPQSQANLYGKISVGEAKPFGDESAKLSGFVEIAADWETRRWFTEYRLRATEMANNRRVQHIARVGMAPYLGDYGDLHTWFMVQVENHPRRDRPIATTPHIRLFKGVQMVEIGYTVERDEWLANWIVRF
ncbi:MAG: hypothetical protein AB8G16_07010 [Gammaproteobacteria bacterium]